METTISGVSNWRLHIRQEREGITILRAVTCDAESTLPEALFGLPVMALSDHALAPGVHGAEGEVVTVTGAPCTGEWDNRNLRSLTLPRTLLRIGNYAFLNCGQLHKITLFDNIKTWGGSVFMNCRLLSAFDLTREAPSQGETLAYLCDVLPGELDITVTESDGRAARYLFPDYWEHYEENCPAHLFHLEISGAGYPYHHCFERKSFDPARYDQLWGDFLRTEHEDDAALRIAWYRLRYPLGLRPETESQYLEYLRTHTAEALRWRLTENDADGLRALLNWTKPAPALLAEACALAREQSNPQAVALLLEEQHRHAPVQKSFDL